jgi:hypothetical protein
MTPAKTLAGLVFATALAVAACGGSAPAGGVIVTPGPQVPPGNPARACAVPVEGAAEDASHPTTVVGTGTPASCTPEAFEAAPTGSST